VRFPERRGLCVLRLLAVLSVGFGKGRDEGRVHILCLLEFQEAMVTPSGSLRWPKLTFELGALLKRLVLIRVESFKSFKIQNGI
jgi:hypothetical protein